MTLARRMSLFFLAVLAAVLVGFSASLYLLGRSYLTQQLDVHLEKALDTLEASVDVETDGLEWEPLERRLTLGMDPGEDHTRWVVQDARGKIIDRSPNIRPGEFPPPIPDGLLPERPGDATVLADLPGWRLGRRHLRLAELLRLGKGHDEDDGPDDDVEYGELILTVGLSPGPVEASLRRLAFAAAGVSAVLWGLCAAFARRMARRALVPMLRMADAARGMSEHDMAELPNPGTRDELEELAHAFNALLARRHEALERQRRFAGDASHQLRTPLAGLLSLIEVVRRRPRPIEEYEETLDRVHLEATRLRQIIESLLFLARAEAEAVPPGGQPLDLSGWIPDQLRAWSGHPRAADLDIRPGAGPAYLHASPPLLSQVLNNLVDNALKYSQPGTPVTVSWAREPDAVSFTVQDRGLGLSRIEAAAIFEPFYRSPHARRLGSEGVGLGLSVARRIVTALGGTIEATSTVAEGTRFVVRLPASDPGPGPGSSLAMAQREAGGSMR
ncbi:HAMP domain-containing sensor histidine kinase [Tundrisphaera sp. TA3]|uniref:sensor histidine kinase n=1 Tax=Tundrisphaera sp. TA3 TaxID=3435775 RepID=UPI003EBC2143